MATFKLDGIKGIKRALDQLPNAVAKKVIRQQIRAALKPVRAAVRENAPVESGALRKAVKVRASKVKKRGQIALTVQIGKGDFVGRQDTFYAAGVEFGHDEVRGGRKGAGGVVVGHTEGTHFMEEAFNRTAEGAKNQAEKGIRDGILAEAKKLGSQG
jgi:HK97 gp10 family phage protein